jgi:phosphoglycerate kinase
MLAKKSIRDLSDKDLEGKRVFVRVDFNVPFENGYISDDARIKGALPTIQYLIDHKAKVILASHLGQPKGKDIALTLLPIAKRLSELLGQPVPLASDCVGDDVKAIIGALQPGHCVLLENVRFHPGETANDPAFAKQLADLADIFVQDAFGTAHRAHASTAGIAAFIPAYAGFLVEKEINFLDGAIQNPKRPLAAIIGGSKVSSKIGVLKFLLGKVDVLVIGGGMAFTFLKAMGYEIGKSLCENDKLDEASAFLKEAKTTHTKVMLPVDQVVVKEFRADAPYEIVSIDAIPADGIGVDAGPETIRQIQAEVQSAQTVLWNGPLGVFEMPQFSKGTYEVAHILVESPAVTIVGGGDSASAIAKAGLADKMSHISTGGGASLEFLEGKLLPGIAVLENR